MRLVTIEANIDSIYRGRKQVYIERNIKPPRGMPMAKQITGAVFAEESPRERE